MSNRTGKIGGTILRGLIRPFSLLPLGVHRACGRAVGRFLGNILRYRRDVVMINLAKSFPEKKYDELMAIRRRFYEHLGTVACEAVWFGGCTSPERLRRSHIAEIENTSLLNRYYDEGKSVFVMYSHSGNWELIGGYVSYAYAEPMKFSEKDICVVYRRLASPAWNHFIGENRKAPLDDRKHYEGMIESYSALRYILRHRNERKMYNFIADQFPYTSSSCVDVGTFLSQHTLSMDGAAAMARKLAMPLLYMGMTLKEDGNYRIYYRTIAEDASQFSVRELLTRYYSMLEEDIRLQPWNYLWTHKRWK